MSDLRSILSAFDNYVPPHSHWKQLTFAWQICVWGSCYRECEVSLSVFPQIVVLLTMLAIRAKLVLSSSFWQKHPQFWWHTIKVDFISGVLIWPNHPDGSMMLFIRAFSAAYSHNDLAFAMNASATHIWSQSTTFMYHKFLMMKVDAKIDVPVEM